MENLVERPAVAQGVQDVVTLCYLIITYSREVFQYSSKQCKRRNGMAGDGKVLS